MHDSIDLAQLCLNGHVINFTMRGYPQNNKRYCDRCGEPTISCCQSCQAVILGLDYGGVGAYCAPLYCHQCGKAYPWTERRQAAALELFVETLDIEREEQEELERNLKAIATENPRTQVAAVKINRMLGRAGAEVAKTARDILVDIASETAKKVLFPGQP